VTASSPLPFGTVGVGYSRKLTASGPGPYSWSVAGGTLPPGLTLTSDGTVTGTPTTAGSYSFVPQVTNGSQTDTQSSGVAIEIVQPLALTTPLPPAPGVVGSPYAVKLAASGGKPPYTFSTSAGAVPPGLTLDPATGDLTGTPTAAGAFQLTVTVSDAIGNAKPVPTVVTIVRELEAATKRLPLAKLNVPYRGSLVALGGLRPVRWETQGTLPRGIRLAPKNGLLLGKPRVAGVFELTFQVTDKLGNTSSQDLILTVRAPKLVVVKKPLPAGKAGKAYRGRVWARGGAAPRRFAVVRGSLPQGVKLNRTNGRLVGKPRAAGRSRFVVRVTDSVGTSAARAFVIVVRK
jgi:large repetitive protein